MKNIIEPVDRKLLVSELTEQRLLKEASFGGNKIYSINNFNSPNVMREIGRLRELAFRKAGGGTGEDIDIDEFDIHPTHPYEQIVIWNPKNEQILGGYRYLLCGDSLNPDGSYDLATTELFNFSDRFKTEYMPYTLELGRSFVYQENPSIRKSIFTLDNLWEGIGIVLATHPQIKYLFGKVTMYLDYDKLARDYILYFLKKHFCDTECLLSPKEPLGFFNNEEDLAKIFTGKNQAEDYKILFSKVRERKHNIPPLINSYINLSRTMKTFGTTLNKGFGAVEETGILITVSDIITEKFNRYILSYRNSKILRNEAKGFPNDRCRLL